MTVMMPSKAQARMLGRLWTSADRSTSVMVRAAPGQEVYNDATTVALMMRGWIYPGGKGDDGSPGYGWAVYLLSFEGMVALHRFIGREIELSAMEGEDTARRIEARSDETPEAAQPEGREPDLSNAKGAP